MGAMSLGVVGSAQAQPTKSSAVTVLNSSKTPGKNGAAIASVLKLTEAELKTQVQSGKTLAQIATAQGVSVQSVIGVLVTDMQAHIAQEVASGKITQAEATTKLASVTAKATERVNSVQPARGEGNGPRGGPKGPGKNVAAIASVLKLTEAELKTQMQSGKTLAQIATAQSVSVQSVINVLVADMQAHIAEELASGKITQAQATTKLAGVTAKATERVNNLPPARGEGTRGNHNNGTAPNA